MERMAEVCENLLKSDDDRIRFSVAQFIWTRFEAAGGKDQPKKPTESGTLGDPLDILPEPRLDE